ncbi:MAG: M4 family metallopeptidase, partial [Planctomycetota bacterium]
MKKSIKQAAKPTDKSDHYFFWLAGLTLLWAVAGAAAAQMPDKANAAETQKDIAQLLSSMHGPNGAMAESGKGKSARVSLKDGCLRSLAAPANHFFPVSEIVAGNPTATAKNFIAEHGVAFGIKSKAVGFAPKSSKKRNSRSYERFRQTYSGIPVYGAEVIVQLNASGGVEYVASDIIRQTSAFDEGKVTVIPTILAEDAEFLAIELMAERHKGLQLVSTDAQLLIYQPAVVGNSGSTRLVWQTVVVSVSVPTVNEFILIDAHTGEVALQYTQIMNARVRQVHDSANTAADPGTLRRSEGGPTTGIADVDDCYDFLSDIYDFYFDEHGRDSIDDAGMTLSATVRICPYYPDFCPYSNAFWNGSRMYFGEGFVVDDVTAHEMTHGVTQYESGLIYLNESGAINESFSDMWGEWIDLTNGAGNDASSVRWLMGEDIGAIRNMADPPAFGDPDRMGSPLWYTGSGDNGGVHINSGVGNKLCYLLTDGDTFNGQTITGMGISMVADLFYEAQTNLLTSGSDYADLHNSLTQAAINLGWNVADRNNLENACLATELSFSPPPSPDDNDECVNAICVEDNVPVNGTTIGATGTDITSCASGDAVDVWYSYTPSVSGSVMVSLCGSDYDTTLAIFDGCGGTELACNDDSCGLQSEIILSMTAGNTYLIRVSGYGGQTGTFVLNVTGGQGTCGSPPPSPSVIFSEDFENGLGGFIIDNAFGNGNGLWHLSTACNATLTGHTPVTALFYGLDDSCTYN